MADSGKFGDAERLKARTTTPLLNLKRPLKRLFKRKTYKT
jgi:hypothetical protein